MKQLYIFILFIFSTTISFTQNSEILECGNVLDQSYCYSNDEITSWRFRSMDSTTPLVLSFDSGEIETCCDFLVIYDGPDAFSPELYRSGSSSDLSDVAVLSTGSNIYMELMSDYNFSCGSSFFTQWDWKVECFDNNPPSCDAIITSETQDLLANVN